MGSVSLAMAMQPILALEIFPKSRACGTITLIHAIGYVPVRDITYTLSSRAVPVGNDHPTVHVKRLDERIDHAHIIAAARKLRTYSMFAA